MISGTAKLVMGLVGMQALAASAWAASSVAIWENGKAACRLVLPSGDQRAGRLARSTLDYHLGRFYKIQLPVASNTNAAGTYLVLGTPSNNPLLARLVKAGSQLTAEDLGDEGFRLLTLQQGDSRYLIVYGKSPRALKHACQELVFYHLPATSTRVGVEWPLDVTMKPELAYRGIYMLPCWSPRDSLESWQRVLRFNSELTLNRNWFWLDRFPLAGHEGLYTDTPLADVNQVQSLIDLVNDEGMKFYIGGGWMTWHHGKAVSKDTQKGIDYYLQYLKTLKNFHGFYLEPTGEPEGDGRSAESQAWLAESDGLRQLIRTLLRQRPDFEVAVAVGKFNNGEYLRRMAELDRKQVYWWWCWGNPVRDQALGQFPNILAWQTIFAGKPPTHGNREPPGPTERGLAGSVTSFDPGMGFGNPWSGLPTKINWKEMMPAQPQRNFDPYTIPYFYLQYFFRERTWNLNLSQEGFVVRLQHRLFDADAPADAGKHYSELSRLVLEVYDGKGIHDPEKLAPIRAFLDAMRGRAWTPRTSDTMARMDEVLMGFNNIIRQ